MSFFIGLLHVVRSIGVSMLVHARPNDLPAQRLIVLAESGAGLRNENAQSQFCDRILAIR
jgi:hypothetical protein